MSGLASLLFPQFGGVPFATPPINPLPQPRQNPHVALAGWMGQQMTPQQAMWNQFASNLGSIVGRRPQDVSPIHAAGQRQAQLNEQTRAREIENQLRQQRLDESRERQRRETERLADLSSVIGGPPVEMGPPTAAGEMNVEPGAAPSMTADEYFMRHHPEKLLEMQMQGPDASTALKKYHEMLNLGFKPDVAKQLAYGTLPVGPAAPLPFGMDPEKQAAIRKEYQGLPAVKSWPEVQANFTALRDNLQSGSKSDQTAAIIGFMKSLDPTSVVSNTEAGMVVTGGTLSGTWQSMLDQLGGKGKLGPEASQNLLDTAGRVYQARYQQAQQAQQRYGQLAQNYGMDPWNVVGDPYQNRAANPLAQPQPMAQPQVAPQSQPGPQPQQYTKPDEVPVEDLGTHRDPWAQHRTILDREKARKAREGSTRKILERYGL